MQLKKMRKEDIWEKEIAALARGEKPHVVEDKDNDEFTADITPTKSEGKSEGSDEKKVKV